MLIYVETPPELQIQYETWPQAKLLGQLDCRCVLLVLKRNHVLEKAAKFKSVADIAQVFVKDVAAATGVEVYHCHLQHQFHRLHQCQPQKLWRQLQPPVWNQ